MKKAIVITLGVIIGVAGVLAICAHLADAAKLQETADHVIAMSVLVLNLRKIQCALLQIFAALLAVWMPQRKLTIVQ